MRIFSSLLFLAGAVLPLFSAHALEAVAIESYRRDSGKNLVQGLKVDAVGTRVSRLSDTVTGFVNCGKDGKLYNGSACVNPGGVVIPNCSAGQVLTKLSGTLACVTAPAGADGVDATIPACTEGQVVVVQNGALACRDNDARKAYTNVGAGTVSWVNISAARTVTQTIAVPANATAVMLDIRCGVNSRSGVVQTYATFGPTGLPASYKACYVMGNNAADTLYFGDTQFLPIPKNATSLAITHITGGFSASDDFATTNLTYTFVKGE